MRPTLADNVVNNTEITLEMDIIICKQLAMTAFVHSEIIFIIASSGRQSDDILDGE